MATNVDTHLLELAAKANHDARMMEAAAKVFQDVGEAHLAISKSGLSVKGMSIVERVGHLIELAKDGEIAKRHLGETKPFKAVISHAHGETLQVFKYVDGATSPVEAAKQAANYMREVLEAATSVGAVATPTE